MQTFLTTTEIARLSGVDRRVVIARLGLEIAAEIRASGRVFPLFESEPALTAIGEYHKEHPECRRYAGRYTNPINETEDQE